VLGLGRGRGCGRGGWVGRGGEGEGIDAFGSVKGFWGGGGKVKAWFSWWKSVRIWGYGMVGM